MADFQCIPITFNHFFVLLVFPFALVVFSFIITFLQTNQPIESKPVGGGGGVGGIALFNQLN